MSVPQDKDNMHAVWISTAQGNVVFKAWMPESIGVVLSNNWEASFAQTLQEKLNSATLGLANGVNAAFGYTPRAQSLTALLWQGNSSTEFQLPCKIYASSDVVAEIINPLKNLIAVALPTKTQGGIDPILSKVGSFNDLGDSAKALAGAAKNLGWFKAPSTPHGRSSGEERLDLYIGTFMQINDVVIQDIQFTMPNRIHKSGSPVSCEVTITLLTGETPAAEDAINWFVNGRVGNVNAQGPDPAALQGVTSSILGALRPPQPKP